MIALLRLLFGAWCKRHGEWYRSDFCSQCLRERIAKRDVVDTRGAHIKAEGSWPLTREDNVKPFPRIVAARKDGKQSVLKGKNRKG